MTNWPKLTTGKNTRRSLKSAGTNGQSPARIAIPSALESGPNTTPAESKTMIDELILRRSCTSTAWISSQTYGIAKTTSRTREGGSRDTQRAASTPIAPRR